MASICRALFFLALLIATRGAASTSTEVLITSLDIFGRDLPPPPGSSPNATHGISVSFSVPIAEAGWEYDRACLLVDSKPPLCLDFGFTVLDGEVSASKLRRMSHVIV